MATEAQTRARRKYQREGMDAVTIRWPKTAEMPARIRAAAEMRGLGPTQYIRRIIDEALERAGIDPGGQQ